MCCLAATPLVMVTLYRLNAIAIDVSRIFFDSGSGFDKYYTMKRKNLL